MTPSLTVIMQVRNGGRYLEETLESLAKQTRRDFVLHVWDDGSTDDTRAILDRWLAKRIPGRVIGDQQIGVGPASAQLVESSPTELIARMDSDDLCHPKRLAHQVTYMQSHPNVALLGTQMHRMDDATGQIIGQTHFPLDDAEIRWQLRLSNPINHPTVMMRRSAVLACGNYRDLRPGLDDDLYLRLSQRYSMANLASCLLTYRVHAKSITASQASASDTFRKRRLADCTTVFPGLTEAEAKHLTQLLLETARLDVTKSDLVLLNRAAEQLADVSDLPRDTFKKAPTYRAQLLNLRTRRWKSDPVIKKAWPILKRGYALTRRTSTNQNAATADAAQADSRGAA